MNREIIGKRFGRLVVCKYVGKSANGESFWDCLCDCGNKKTILQGNFVDGATRSCGCLNRELSIKRFTTHGMTKTETYQTWAGMKARCLFVNNPNYKRYGLKGIKICKRWMEFKNFYADMGEKPLGRSIDRIDNSKGYDPENCRWATSREQVLNRTITLRLEYMGRTKTMSEWSDIFKIPYKILHQRISRGWTIERALSSQNLSV